MIQYAITYDNYRFPNKTICDMKLFKNYESSLYEIFDVLFKLV